MTNHDYAYPGESNGLTVPGHEYHGQFSGCRTVTWTFDGLEITRLRLISDPGFPAWDVSYCHGRIGDENVRVQLPFSQLPKKGMKSALYNEAKATGKFIRGLFSALSTLQ